MQISHLNIIGLSEPTLSFIFDNLESNQHFPTITIINNLSKEAEHPFRNDRFDIQVVEHEHQATPGAPFMLGVNKPQSKQSIVRNLPSTQLPFYTLYHHSSSISSTTTIQQGVNINAQVCIAAHSLIEEFVSINRNASVGHHAHIHAFVTINPGAHIAGFTTIGKGSLIGMGALITDGVSIGSNVIIGAGSVVTRDIPDHVIAYGNPCKIIRDNPYNALN